VLILPITAARQVVAGLSDEGPLHFCDLKSGHITPVFAADSVQTDTHLIVLPVACTHTEKTPSMLVASLSCRGGNLGF